MGRLEKGVWKKESVNPETIDLKTRLVRCNASSMRAHEMEPKAQ